MINAQEEEEFIEIGASWINYLIIITAVIVGLTLYRLVLHPNRIEIIRYITDIKTKYKTKTSSEHSERVAFYQLKVACSKRELNEVKEALIIWYNHYLSGNKVKTIEGILQNSDWANLHQQITYLQNELYFHTKSTEQTEKFSTSKFIRNISNLRKLMRKQDKITNSIEKYSLPPLYKT